MINTNELLYVVDEFDMPLTPQPRQKVFQKKLWRRTAHVWIINDKKEILCQKRSMQKDNAPGMWEPAVAGHIGPDDNYFTGAVRELFEETGIEVAPDKLNLFKIYKAHKFREYRGIFHYVWNGKIKDIVREIAEVDEVKFVKINTLKKYLLYDKSKKWISPGYEKEMLNALSKL